MTNDLLRRDVRILADMLGEIISQLAGPKALEMVEEIRLLARERRGGSREAEQQLAERIAAFDYGQARTVARAFSIFFDLANIAEDRQRVRVLREREARLEPQPIPETLAAAIAELKQAGFAAEAVQEALDHLSVELVFTAHPSEAKRRSIRAKLRRMRHALEELDRDDLLPRERRRSLASLRAELSVIWQTEFLRPGRPTVLEEVERGLSIMPRVWEVVPAVYRSLENALAEHYPGHAFRVPVFLQFGSWMGGDRDGNPHVTADVTARTLCQLRNSAIDRHLQICKQMYDYLTISETAAPRSEQLTERVEAALAQWPPLAEALANVAPHEAYRRWIKTIEWRLGQSRVTDIEAPALSGDYGDGGELVADVAAICDCLAADYGSLLSDSIARRWYELVRTFGLHLTRLDIRQDARRYQEVLTEIFQSLGVTPDFAALDDAARAKVLGDTMDFDGDVPIDKLGPLAADTVRLYKLMQRAMVRFGSQCLGANVISLTRSASDVLGVLWLWRHAQAAAPRSGQRRSAAELKIAPLFEKIGDLQRASQTLRSMLGNPHYANYLASQGNRQVVMVGYSDSTKDGGYLAACWGLQRAQSELHRVAAQHGVSLTFFHGRGGSLGRGGGPAARGILSLPSETLDGTLRLTEQGEVLAERYDDVQIAYRHLEQVTWATLVGSTVRKQAPQAEWVELLEQLSQRSLAVYRDLVDQPGFMQFFAETTPIDEIENLPIGSRPARRRGERSLGDLRAIPWVFSWTQNRTIIPAWYGLGTALAETKQRDPAAWTAIGEMYEKWPFFQATIDNAELALAKADMYVAQRYASLNDGGESRGVIWSRILAEFGRSREAILDVVGEPELLAATPWFQRSIEARNPYIDPLNLIQIEFMRRRRSQAGIETGAAEEERLRDLLRLTVQGIAAGMRTTG
ncbi:MAG TPA: phosphoenolpyruvate carboxylase [Pirellulales bacterium]|nr:phosphoenolpyruvate carboxylase [Pirellulales bacterium]